MIWFVGTVFAIALLVLTGATLLQGRRIAPVCRRLLVACVLASLVTAPALPTLLLYGVIGRGVGERGVVKEDGTMVLLPDEPPRGPPDLILVVLLVMFSLSAALQSLRLPKRLGHLQRLPPVADAAIVQRIRELAERLGTQPPLVVESASVSGSLDVHAVTGGILAPLVVVSDGVMHRLPPQERDAVLAHELAHVARQSLLRHFGLATLVAVAAVLLSGYVPLLVAIAWYLATLVFARSCFGHRDEVQADLAAGRCVGQAAAAAALDKVHAANLQVDAGPWFHAVLSHPSPAVRAACLAEAALPEERAHIAVDAGLVRRCRRARRTALAVWATLLAAVAVLGTLPGLTAAVSVLGLLLVFVPLLPMLAFTRELRDALQLGLASGLWRLARRLLLVSLAVLCLFLQGEVKGQAMHFLLLGGTLVCLGIALFGGRRVRRVQRELGLLLQQRDLAGYLKRCGAMKPAWRRRPRHRLQEALVRAALGEREAAVQELLALAQQRPRLHMARLWAAALLRDTDPQRSVSLCREVLSRIPGNALAQASLAGALRSAGALDEAWQQIQATERNRPRSGPLSALTARIALTRGDLEAAAEGLARAERLAPGDSATALARAEHDVRTDSPQARASLDRLRELAARTPFAFLDQEVAHLEEEWRRRGGERPAGVVAGT